MPQNVIAIPLLNSPRAQTAATLPLAGTEKISVQIADGGLRECTVADIIGGGGGIAGSGTTNTVPRFTASGTIGNSGATNNGTTYAIARTNITLTGIIGLTGATTVTGTFHATGAATFDSTLAAAGTTVTTLHATGAATLDSTLAAHGTTVTTLHGTGLATLDAALQLTALTFATLPGTPVAGMIAFISDGNANTWGTAVTASGADPVMVIYNGTAWTVIGK